MTSPNDIGLTATFDASQMLSESGKVVNLLKLMQTAMQDAAKASELLPKKLEAGTAARTKTVVLYQKLVQLGGQYSTAQLNAAKAADAGTKATLRLSSQLGTLERNLSKVTGTEQKDYQAKARTLELYSKLIGLSAQAAQVKQREAAASKALADAEARRTNTSLKTSGASAAAANLAAQKKADQEATAATRAAVAAEKQRAAALNTSAAAQGKLEQKLASTRYALYQVGAAYAAVSAPLLAVPALAVKTGVEYEKAFAQVERTTGQTSEQLQGLKADLEDLAETIPTSFTDLSQIASLGAQMGIGAEGLDEFTSTVAKFAASSNVAAEDASTAFGRLSNLLKIPTAQYENLGSAVAYLGVNSAATESEILAVAQSISATGHTAGLSTQTILGLSSAMASLKVSPEIGRSALQRLFAEIDVAAADGGKQLQMFAKALGMTSEQFLKLRANNPDKMLLSLLGYFHDVTESGGNLTKVFQDLGIYSLRSAPIYQRLASSIDLVTASINQATTSYAQGTFLNTATQPVFDTIAARAEKAKNSVLNLLDSFGESSVVTSSLKGLLNVIQGVADAVDKLPEPVKVAIVTFTTFVGVWAAYKAAVSLGGAAILAFRQVSDVGLTSARLNLSELRREAILAFTGEREAAIQATGAIEGNATATGAATAATRAHTAAVEADVAALRTQAGAAGAAGEAAVAGAATSGLGAGAGVGVGAAASGMAKAESGATKLLGTTKKLAGSFAKVAGIGLAFSLAFGAIDAIMQATSSHTETLEEKTKRLGAAVLQAAGGADTLRTALEADAKADDPYAKIVTNVKDLGDGTARVTKEFVSASGRSHELSSETYQLANAVDAGAKSQQNAATQVGATIDQLKEQTVVLGQNAAAWEAGAIRQYLQQTGFTAQDYDVLKQNGLKAGQIISDAIKQGVGGDDPSAGVLAKINGAIDAATNKLNGYQQKINDITKEVAKAQANAAAAAGGAAGFAIPIPELGTDPKTLANLRKQVSQMQSNIDVMNKFKDAVVGGDGAIQQAIVNNQVFTDIMKALGIESDDTTDDLSDLGTTTETLAQQTQDAADAFGALINRMQGMVDAQAGLAGAYDALGKSLANNGATFDILTEAGRNNMQALSAIVGQYTQILQSNIESGEITAAQAAQQMGQYMANLVQQLANIGVPTDQIDYLVRYLQTVTGAKWTIGVNADITGVVNAVNTAQQMLDALAADRDVVARSSGTSPAALVAAGTYNNYRRSNNIYSGPTSFFSQPSVPDLNKVFQNAVLQQHAANLAKQQEQNQKDLAKAEKDAGDAAEAAGKKQQEAAELAAEALEKQKQYVQDLASYYGDLSGNMFSLVDAEGSTFESLQQLGQSLVENGKQFNTLTDAGRANFSALEKTFSSFGDVLQDKVSAGVLTASQATNQFKQFASGVYSELVKMGVPQQNILAFFKGIGISTTGWTKASAAVKQYGGFITSAVNATKAAQKEADKADEKLASHAEKVADYVSRLGDALNNTYQRLYGMGEATDAVSRSWQALSDRLKDAAKQVKDLREQNDELRQSIQEQNVTANKAYIEYRLSLKYGEKDRAADYKSQYDAAKLKIKQDQDQIKQNKKQADSIEKNSKQLKGNSKEAMDNRDSLRDLQKQMISQIQEYARAGHTQREVKRYADQLKRSFAEQAQQLGFSKDQVQPYIDKFDTLTDKIKDVPKVVNTEVNITNNTKNNTTNTTVSKTEGVSASKAALNSIPHGRRTMRTDATYHGVAAVKRAIRGIPKRADYKVKAKPENVASTKKNLRSIGGHTAKFPVSTPGYGGAKLRLDGLGKPRRTKITVDTVVHRKVVKVGDYYGMPMYQVYEQGKGFVGNRFLNKGGLVKRGFADGGLVPGTPPADPTKDNVLAKGPDGMFAIRSGEYVQPQKAVDFYGLPFMNALRDLTYRPVGYNGGGAVGNGSNAAFGNMLIVQLSPEDRRLLSGIGDQPVVLRLSDREVASSARRGGYSNSRRGGS